MSDRSERQSARIKAILRDLQQGGSLSIEDLCERYGASLATIRRDLQELEDRGLLRRIRGGAMPIEPLFYEPFRTSPSFQDLVGRHAEEKRRIGQAAAELLEPGNTLSLTAGTTTTEVVRCLPYEYNLKVITNTVNVAMELSKRKDVDVFVTGGHLRGAWQHDLHEKAGPTPHKPAVSNQAQDETNRIMVTNLHYELTPKDLMVCGGLSLTDRYSLCSPVRFW